MNKLKLASGALAFVFAFALTGCGGGGDRPGSGALRAAMEAAGNVVYFDLDQSVLRPDARRVLDAHIAVLRRNNASIRLEGHADERGTREYNLALGERRANSVADYMSVNGISGRRIETVSYGEERPVALGSGEFNWRQNRRVEIIH